MDSGKGKVFCMKPCEDHAESLLQKLYEYQQQSNLTDFIIVVNGKEISVHRNVISAKCPYFESLFSSGMKEAKEGKVTLDTLDYDVIKSIVAYLYGNKVDIVGEKVPEIVDACELLLLDEIKDQVCKFVSEEMLATENSISLLQMADKYQMEELARKCEALMLSNFEGLAKSEEFMLLSFAELKDLICAKVECSRDVVLEAALKWVAYEKASRLEDVLDLMNIVDISQCSLDCLNMTNKTFRDILVDSHVKHMIICELYERATISKTLLLCGGMGQFNDLVSLNSKVWTCSLANQDLPVFDWSELTTIPATLKNTQVPIVPIPGGFAVVCGGGNFQTNSIYTVETKSWTDLPDTPVSIKDPSAVFCDEWIYVLGSSAVYCIGFSQRCWEKQPAMSHSGYWPAAAAIDKSVYACVDWGYLQQFQKGQNQWNTKAKHPGNEDIHGAQFVPMEESLYLVGGSDNICSHYNTVTDVWTTLMKPLEPSLFPATFLWMKNIYILGGRRDNNEIDTIHIYNTEKNIWIKHSKTIPKALSFAKAFVFN